MLPAITFIFSRKACDEARDACLDAGLRLTTTDERARVRAIVDERTATLADADLDVLGFDRFLAGLEAGVAAHHAGMVPPFKEAVEACFTAGLTKAVFATETLALGVNMPARSVVIERLTKFTGERRELLTPGEYTQLTGRAGRRGIDEVGYAIVLWSPFVPFEQVAALASSRTYALRSAFRPTYNMAANLVRRYEPAQAHHLLNLSFAQFQADQAVVRIEARIDRQQVRLERLRSEARCERGDVDEYRRLRAEVQESRRGSRAEGGQGALDRIYAALSRLDPGRRRGGGRLAARRPQRRLPQGQPEAARRGRAQQAAHDRRRRAGRAPAGPGHRRAAGALQPEQPRLPAPGGGVVAARPSRSARSRRWRRGGGAAGRGAGGRGVPRRRDPPGGGLPRPRRPRALRGAGRARRARAARPAPAGPGSHGVAGPAVRPGAAPAGGVGLPRRLGAHRRRSDPGPHLPRGRSPGGRGDDHRPARRPRRARRSPPSRPASPTSTGAATGRPRRSSRPPPSGSASGSSSGCRPT